jgi:hypothetical protein
MPEIMTSSQAWDQVMDARALACVLLATLALDFSIGEVERLAIGQPHDIDRTTADNQQRRSLAFYLAMIGLLQVSILALFVSIFKLSYPLDWTTRARGLRAVIDILVIMRTTIETQFGGWKCIITHGISSLALDPSSPSSLSSASFVSAAMDISRLTFFASLALSKVVLAFLDSKPWVTQGFWLCVFCHTLVPVAPAVNRLLILIVSEVRVRKAVPYITSQELADLATDDTCSICLGNHDRTTCRLPHCQHLLHRGCLSKMLQQEASRHHAVDTQRCPVCRSNIFATSVASMDPVSTSQNEDIDHVIATINRNLRPERSPDMRLHMIGPRVAPFGISSTELVSQRRHFDRVIDGYNTSNPQRAREARRGVPRSAVISSSSSVSSSVPLSLLAPSSSSSSSSSIGGAVVSTSPVRAEGMASLTDVPDIRTIDPGLDGSASEFDNQTTGHALQTRVTRKRSRRSSALSSPTQKRRKGKLGDERT